MTTMTYMTKALCTFSLLLAPSPFDYALAGPSYRVQDKAVKKSSSLPHHYEARLPVPTEHVSDFAGVVDEKTQTRLENLLKNLQRQAGIEFDLVIVETTGGQDIFEFSRELARDWNVQLSNNANKTFLLVAAVKEKALFTQVSKAAQVDLPEGILGEIRQRVRDTRDSGQFGQSLANAIQFFIDGLAQKGGYSLKAFDQLDTPTRPTAVAAARKGSDQGKSASSRPLEASSAAPSRDGSEIVNTENALKTDHAKPAVTVDVVAISGLKQTSGPSSAEPTLAVAPSKTANAAKPASGTLPNAEEDAAATSASSPSPEAAALIESYRVGVGDVLDIRMPSSSSNRSTLYTVIDGGLIDFPLAGGLIPVAGLTTAEIQAHLAAELKRRTVAEGAQLMVSVRQYSSHTVTVTGLVNYPGKKVLTRETVPLYVIIAEAQARLDAGRVTIMRAGNLGPTLELKDPAALDVNIQAGDVINVTPRPEEFYYIGGQITYPGQKVFRSGITMLQAILAAGGLSRQSAHKIELLREGSDGRLTTTKFDVRDIKSGKVQDLRLQSGDRIEIVQ